jgi:hypothetical protein
MTAEQANQFLADYGQILWFAILTVASIGVLVKAWPFITAVVKTVEIISSLPENYKAVFERLGSLEQKLRAVEHEVKTNGGSSIKDAVLRIEKRLDNMSK